MINCLSKVATTKLISEKENLRLQLEEVDATADYMDTLVEQHKADYLESRTKIADLEEKLSVTQISCGEMEEIISRIEVIKYEIETEEKSERSLDDFVEDLVAENSRLKAAVAEGERSVETKEYKILDLELNVNGLRETLRDIQESYADQSSESKGMEEALRTMQRIFKDQSEELSALKEERDQYQRDVKDMLNSLKQSEETVNDVEAQRRESEQLKQTYEGQLAESKAAIQNLQRERQDAIKMMELKEDVIGTLQNSIKVAANCFLETLDRFAGQTGGHTLTTTESGQESDTLSFLEQRFKSLSEEIEKKDNLLIHLMNEKNTLEADKNVRDQIATQELQDKLDMLTAKIQKLEGEIKSKENSLEEKEMVVTHLVNVVNRYAFNDRDADAGAPKKKISAPDGLQSVSIASAPSRGPDQRRKIQKGASLPTSSRPGFLRRFNSKS